MAEELFTDAWLASCNAALAGAAAPEEGRAVVVAEVLKDPLPDAHPAVTLVADADGVRLVAGEDPRTTAWISISVADAEALHRGALDPAAALAEGRVRVRGDLRAVVEAAATLADAHARLRAR